jgi:hypothetical protein
MDNQDDDLLFVIETPLGFHVRCHSSYWERKIIDSHPIMYDKLEVVIQALENPAEIRVSQRDSAVYLFYNHHSSRLVCVVARDNDGIGHIITAYPTDKMKKGTTVWTR